MKISKREMHHDACLSVIGQVLFDVPQMDLHPRFVYPFQPIALPL